MDITQKKPQNTSSKGKSNFSHGHFGLTP